MKREIIFLLGSVVILFVMIILLDFTYMTKFVLWFIWSTWSVVIAMCYAIIWRESVDCRCLEKETEE